jgi:uncharacterized membrane protein YidH (DUF202 family)
MSYLSHLRHSSLTHLTDLTHLSHSPHSLTVSSLTRHYECNSPALLNSHLSPATTQLAASSTSQYECNLHFLTTLLTLVTLTLVTHVTHVTRHTYHTCHLMQLGVAITSLSSWPLTCVTHIIGYSCLTSLVTTLSSTRHCQRNLHFPIIPNCKRTTFVTCYIS